MPQAVRWNSRVVVVMVYKDEMKQGIHIPDVGDEQPNVSPELLFAKQTPSKTVEISNNDQRPS